MIDGVESFAGRFVVVAVPGRRIELFAEALARRGLAAPVIVPWLDLLEGRVRLTEVVRADDVVRIESPGKHFETERAILALGATTLGAGADADVDAVAALVPERGRILWPRQWYAGFCAALGELREQLSECPLHRCMSAPDDIPVMFDKRLCHERLREAGVNVPAGLGMVRSYDELIQRMRDRGFRRVFIKSAHGSSASGVVAYQINDAQELATTTVELNREDDELRLYNSRLIRTYRDGREIVALIDALCRQHVHVEQWLPKAGIARRSFDLRVVVIRGRARHVVVRTSRSPMTNLHLLNQHGDVAAVRECVGNAMWEEALHQSERAMAAFPRSLHGGVDVMITADHRRAAVLEVNAFGDLLPGELWNGIDAYEAEIAEMIGCDRAIVQEVA